MLSAKLDASKFMEQLKSITTIAERKKLGRKAVTEGGKQYKVVAKARCPVRDTAAALKSAGVKIGKVKRKVGAASYTEYSDKKGKLVTIKYKGGLLKKAQDYKVISRNRVAIAICGTADGFRKQIGVRQRAGKSRGGDSRRKRKFGKQFGGRTLAKAGDAIYADPAKYAHLVIGGTKNMQARDFHTPATRAAEYATMQTMYEETSDLLLEAAR